jgi:hypothetical protein
VKAKELINRYVEMGLRQPTGVTPELPAAKAGEEQPFVSAYELMKDGCGIVKSGVPNLASNPKHLEGFGRD